MVKGTACLHGGLPEETQRLAIVEATARLRARETGEVTVLQISSLLQVLGLQKKYGYRRRGGVVTTNVNQMNKQRN